LFTKINVTKNYVPSNVKLFTPDIGADEAGGLGDGSPPAGSRDRTKLASTSTIAAIPNKILE